MSLKGIILAGGAGTRLAPASRAINKHLVPVYDKPMIFYPLATLLEAGVDEVLLISCPPDLPRFRRLLGDGDAFGISIAYRAQRAPRGIADALRVGARFAAGSPVALILGDNVFHAPGLGPAVREAAGRLEGATIFARAVKDPRPFGVVALDRDQRPMALEEKPRRCRSRLAVTGLYLYGPEAYARARRLRPSQRGELEITDLNRLYLEEGRLRVVVLGPRIVWRDAGTPEGLFAASAWVRRAQARGALVGSPEAVAFRRGLIDSHALEARVRDLGAGDYARRLQSLLTRKAA